jgi:hypothetical protein
MPRVGLEPAIRVFERANTVHALDRAATGIDTRFANVAGCVRFVRNAAPSLSSVTESPSDSLTKLEDTNCLWLLLIKSSSFIIYHVHTKHGSLHSILTSWASEILDGQEQKCSHGYASDFCFREVPGSNFGLKTRYTDFFFRLFSSFKQISGKYITSNWASTPAIACYILPVTDGVAGYGA